MDIYKVMTFAVVMGLISFCVGMFTIMVTDNILGKWGKFWDVFTMVLVIGGIIGVLGGLITLISVWAFS